jgi:hypothetical protein
VPALRHFVADANGHLQSGVLPYHQSCVLVAMVLLQLSRAYRFLPRYCVRVCCIGVIAPLWPSLLYNCCLRCHKQVTAR